MKLSLLTIFAVSIVFLSTPSSVAFADCQNPDQIEDSVPVGGKFDRADESEAEDNVPVKVKLERTTSSC